MNYFVSVAVLLPLVFAGTISVSLERDPHAELFVAWKEKYGKEYISGVEEVSRFNVWKENMEKVMEHNLKYDLGLSKYTLEMNKFADLTSEEFGAQRLGMRKALKAGPVSGEPVVSVKSVPDSIDWRTYGYVTAVKDQGACGSCWAFSTTGGIEGQHFNATGTLVSLSEQQLVDCDFTNFGCHGGSMSGAVTWLSKNGGSVSESDYPYISGTTKVRGSCQTGLSVAATVSSYVGLPSYSEDALKSAVGTVGPCSIAIDASDISFQLYKKGIYDPEICSQYALDHGVLAAGYGTEDGTDYWLVKNSWGTNWGEAGYIKMIRNHNNKCGVASQAIYPVV